MGLKLRSPRSDAPVVPHDVFISYASRDRTVATALCASLESRRIRCWIAPRDVLPGTEYAESIVDGIADCHVFIVVFSADANQSPQVKREVERAVSKAKTILPFRIEDVTPTRSMEFCLSNTHWLDAMTPPLESHLARLGETVVRLLNIGAELSAAERGRKLRPSEATATPEPEHQTQPAKRSPLSKLPPPPGMPHVPGHDFLVPKLEGQLSRLGDAVTRLLKNRPPDRASETPSTSLTGNRPGYEYRTTTTFFGIPLMHVALDLPRVNGRPQVARGIIAIGDHARGVVAIGTVAVGGIALGSVSVGIIPVGFMSIGVCSTGAMAAGLIGSYGVLSVGPVAIGCLALGYYGMGGFAVGHAVWTETVSDSEAVQFFQSWVNTGLHVFLVLMCFLSYFGPRLAHFWGRMICRVQAEARAAVKGKPDARD